MPEDEARRLQELAARFDRFFAVADHEDPAYIGLTVEQALHLARQNGVELGPRLIDAGGGTTILLDRRPSRLNFVVEDGKVIRAGFF